MMRPAALLLALFVALPAAAQVYSWRDKDGRLNYADQPPASGEVKLLQDPRQRQAQAAPAARSSGDAAAAASNKPKTLAERELEFRQRRAEAAEADAKEKKEAAEMADRQRYCEQLRNQLSALNSGQRVSRFNSAGEREYLDDAARAAEIDRQQQQLEQNCQS